MQNLLRSFCPEIFVAVGLCSHLGCVPMYRPELASRGFGEAGMGGYYCPCHGSKFDWDGRVFKNVPASTNLVVPPHRYLNRNVPETGVDHA